MVPPEVPSGTATVAASWALSAGQVEQEGEGHGQEQRDQDHGKATEPPAERSHLGVPSDPHRASIYPIRQRFQTTAALELITPP